jgi:hypothetical protein
MPTSKPRFTVTCEPNLYETLDRYSALTGSTKGKLVHDMLEGIHHPLMRMVALLEAAKDAPEDTQRGLVNGVTQLEREITGLYEYGLNQLDWLQPKAPKPNTKTGGLNRASRGELPPYSNTGVGHDS